MIEVLFDSRKQLVWQVFFRIGIHPTLELKSENSTLTKPGIDVLASVLPTCHHLRPDVGTFHPVPRSAHIFTVPKYFHPGVKLTSL